DGDAALAGVPVGEVAAAVDARDAVLERLGDAQGVQALGALDLDDVRAQVGQDLGGVRAGPDPGKVDDPQARQEAPLRYRARAVRPRGRALAGGEPGPDFRVVLAQPGRRALQAPWGGAQLVRRAGHAQALALLADCFDEVVAVLALRVACDIAGVADRRDRNTLGAALGLQLGLGMRQRERREHLLEQLLGGVGRQVGLVAPACVAKARGALQAFA